jgi:hypothetical protein
MQARTMTLTASHVAEAVGDRTDSWACVDCGVNTAPGIPNAKRIRLEVAAFGSITVKIDENSEVYRIKPRVVVGVKCASHTT